MDPSFVVAAAIAGGFALLWRAGAKAYAAKAAVASAESAADSWLYDNRIRGLPIEMICGSVPAAFDDDERVLCVLPGVDLLEPRAVRRSNRAGLSYHGVSTGLSESESIDELRQIDQGTLILTTKRLAFFGSLRTNNSSLDDLIGVKDVGNGIQVHRERKQKAETYVLTSALIVDGRVVTGAMVQLAIEMAKLAREVDALLALPEFPRIKWKKSPPYSTSDNPLHSGSLYGEVTSAVDAAA